jgi:hypothetical protein
MRCPGARRVVRDAMQQPINGSCAHGNQSEASMLVKTATREALRVEGSGFKVLG